MTDKRYNLYNFPSLHGTPRGFNTKLSAYIYAVLYDMFVNVKVWDLEDKKRCKYIASWR
ncbi:MAG: hypothetical protein JRJ00_00185 [Deltaproteobacteria bacterium]|nr:hypothetical protein [Deltaproteobacteria bacterium]